MIGDDDVEEGYVDNNDDHDDEDDDDNSLSLYSSLDAKVLVGGLTPVRVLLL